MTRATVIGCLLSQFLGTGFTTKRSGKRYCGDQCRLQMSATRVQPHRRRPQLSTRHCFLRPPIDCPLRSVDLPNQTILVITRLKSHEFLSRLPPGGSYCPASLLARSVLNLTTPIKPTVGPEVRSRVTWFYGRQTTKQECVYIPADRLNICLFLYRCVCEMSQWTLTQHSEPINVKPSFLIYGFTAEEGNTHQIVT